MIDNKNKPKVKFVVNVANFNKLLEILTFQKENIITEEWQKKAEKLREKILKYAMPEKIENEDKISIDIRLFESESAELIVLLLSAFDCISIREDYTKLMKNKIEEE